MSQKWSSTDDVQARVLDAALQAFIDKGYTEAKLTDVVHLSGVSIGSVYHHFGGKEHLFAACHERLRDEILDEAGMGANEAAVHGQWERPYLLAIRARREGCSVFLSADTPPGFTPIEKGAAYYADLGDYASRMLAAVLLESMRILCDCGEDQVLPVIDSTVKLLNVVRALGF